MSKVKFNFSKKINPKEKEEKGVPLVVTYHPSLNCLSEIIRDNLHLLYMKNKVKKVFSPKSISFRSARKLSSYLVRAKLYPIERTVRSFKCTKKHCEVCKNVNITDSFTSSVRPWLVESSVIVLFCVITSMSDAVIINYQLFLY